jgi:hypothetical protein
MPNLETRITKLEKHQTTGDVVTTIVLVSLPRNGRPKPELIAVRDMEGRRWEKLPDENHDTFISRARGDCDGIKMLYEDKVRWPDGTMQATS